MYTYIYGGTVCRLACNRAYMLTQAMHLRRNGPAETYLFHSCTADFVKQGVIQSQHWFGSFTTVSKTLPRDDTNACMSYALLSSLGVKPMPTMPMLTPLLCTCFQYFFSSAQGTATKARRVVSVLLQRRTRILVKALPTCLCDDTYVLLTSAV